MVEIYLYWWSQEVLKKCFELNKSKRSELKRVVKTPLKRGKKCLTLEKKSSPKVPLIRKLIGFDRSKVSSDQDQDQVVAGSKGTDEPNWKPSDIGHITTIKEKFLWSGQLLLMTKNFCKLLQTFRTFWNFRIFWNISKIFRNIFGSDGPWRNIFSGEVFFLKNLFDWLGKQPLRSQTAEQISMDEITDGVGRNF